MAYLPPVTLLRGPRSVGKRTLAEALVKHHGGLSLETRTILTLSMDEAREVKSLCERAPMGPLRGFIIRLDGASEHVLNAMLKVLEEPPDSARFLLLAEGPVLPTIASRSVTYRMGLLSDAEMGAVLAQQGMVGTPLASAVMTGRGQVDKATGLYDIEAARSRVLAVIKAIGVKDRALLEKALPDWGPDTHQLLVTWCVEAVTGRWRVFSARDASGVVGAPMELLTRLRFNARPKLMVRVAAGQMIGG
jgi:hypothetical protein